MLLKPHHPAHFLVPLQSREASQHFSQWRAARTPNTVTGLRKSSGLVTCGHRDVIAQCFPHMLVAMLVRTHGPRCHTAAAVHDT